MRSVFVIFFGEQSEEVSEVSEARRLPHPLTSGPNSSSRCFHVESTE
jgi:hypothetical protein